MNGGCNAECSCCVDGQCKPAISCSTVLQLSVIIGSIFGFLILILIFICVSFKVTSCLKNWRKTRRVMGAQNTSTRTRMVENGGENQTQAQNESVLQELLEYETNQASLGKKVPMIRAFPDKEIPTTVPFSMSSIVPFKISKLEPIQVIVGDVPTGKPIYMTESIKTLAHPRGKVDPYKSVVVKQNSSLRSNASVNRPIIPEEGQSHELSNISLMDRPDRLTSLKHKADC